MQASILFSIAIMSQLISLVPDIVPLNPFFILLPEASFYRSDYITPFYKIFDVSLLPIEKTNLISLESLRSSKSDSSLCDLHPHPLHNANYVVV